MMEPETHIIISQIYTAALLIMLQNNNMKKSFLGWALAAAFAVSHFIAAIS